MQCTIQIRKKNQQQSIDRLCLVFCNDLPVYSKWGLRVVGEQHGSLIPLPLTSHVHLSCLVHEYCVETATSHMYTQETQRSVGEYFLDYLHSSQSCLFAIYKCLPIVCLICSKSGFSLNRSSSVRVAWKCLPLLLLYRYLREFCTSGLSAILPVVMSKESMTWSCPFLWCFCLRM